MSLRTALKPAEIKPFSQRSNGWGWWLLCVNWGMIVFAFALPVIWAHPVAILFSLILLANRQLGLAILMHECAHYSLFESRALNKWVGTILCAAPVIADLDGYRSYHMRHHKQAGTDTDPDYPNYQHYPVTRASMFRKIARDLTGITAVKTLYALLLMNSGVLNYDMAYQSHKAEKKLSVREILINLKRNLAAPILVHSALFLLLWSLGHAWLYGLWWLSYLTLYMVFLRIRNAAEHGNVPDLLDTAPEKHARTTRARWWERLTVAPNFVNFHMEHHLRPNVPCYRLKAFHEYLLSNNLVDSVDVAQGYAAVMRQLVRS